MTRGRIEKGHMEKLEDDTRPKTNWHVSIAHIATWTVTSSPRRYPLLRHVLRATLPASVDEATWSASVSYGACQRGRAHVDPGVQWRFSDASTKQKWFRDEIFFRREKNILVMFRLFRQGKPNSMLHFWQTEFRHKFVT